jgi:membrane-bound serine protease (ClpP class)
VFQKLIRNGALFRFQVLSQLEEGGVQDIKVYKCKPLPHAENRSPTPANANCYLAHKTIDELERNSMSKLTKTVFTLSAMLILLCISLNLAFDSTNTHAYAQNQSNPVINPFGPLIIANFNVPVDPGSSTFFQRVVASAVSQNASAIIIEMNTPGGLLSDMTSIIDSITTANESDIPTYTYVVANGLAASAGSYIAMATNRILMGSGAAIGPSTPIVVGGTPLEQNHTQAAMLKLMVSEAQKWGRNVTAVYDMVQYDVAYSTDEAVKYHVVDASAESLDDAIGMLGLSGRKQITLSENLYEQFVSALSNPILDGILILLGVLAIVVDVYHPTIVLTVVGAIALVAGLVGAEVIDASLLGFVIIAIAAFLIVVELKLGHGFALISGIVLGVIGILLLTQGLAYSPSPITSGTELALFFVIVIGVVAGLYIRWVLGPLRRRQKLTGPEALIGEIGTAVTDLMPDGEVRAAGIVWRAESVSGNIKKGESVRVKSLKGLVVVVEKV